MKVGLYFGSFNPIHNGHISIANYCAEMLGLDAVHFVVTNHNPFKDKNGYVSFDMRSLMVYEGACINSAKLKVEEIEKTLPTPSYTIDTINAIKEREQSETLKLYIIMGMDNFCELSSWKNVEELCLNSIIVLNRPNSSKSFEEAKHDLEEYLGKELNNVTFVDDLPYNAMSSTFIRQMIKSGKDIIGYVPPLVRQIIHDYNLYKN